MKMYPIASYIESDQQQFYYSWGLENLSIIGFLLHKWSLVASMGLGAAAFIAIYLYMKQGDDRSAGGIALVGGAAAGIGGKLLMRNLVATLEMAIQGVVMPYAPLVLGIAGFVCLAFIWARLSGRSPRRSDSRDERIRELEWQLDEAGRRQQVLPPRRQMRVINPDGEN